MNIRSKHLALVLALFTPLAMAQSVPNRVFLAGSAAVTHFLGAHALSSGDILICGSTDDLGWTGNAPKTEFPADGLTHTGGSNYGFILQVSSDLGTIKRVYHFPKGAVGTISRIRSTEVPGKPTGLLFISGEVATFTSYKDDGYFICRLDANGVEQAPTRPVWSVFVQAGERDAMGFKPGQYKGDAEYKRRQPWDVRNDGSVVYVTGVPFDFSWSAMQCLTPDGKPGKMPAWSPSEDGGTRLVLKVLNDGSLRSVTQADFDYRQEDENGNPGRKGRYPNDYYFTKPDDKWGPGYTGYKIGRMATHRIGKIAIDRRNNHLYFGYSQQTRLPGGNPDFEPAIVAMDDTGKLKWWARGYREIERVGENEKKPADAINSPPDQFVDQVAIDYVHNRLLVMARCHGNGVINYWKGNEIKANSGRHGFQNGFTGNNGNIHFQWLGAYDLDRCRITAATYIGELGHSLTINKTFTDGPLKGWPDPNAGWMNIETTRIGDLEVDRAGRPCMVGIGKRSFTTVDAVIPNVVPTGGDNPKPAWSPFARVYDADLGGIAYSTMVRGPWDSVKGTDDLNHDVDLKAVLPLQGQVLVVGVHTSGPGGGSNLPTTGVPSWGKAAAPGKESGVVALVKVKEP